MLLETTSDFEITLFSCLHAWGTLWSVHGSPHISWRLLLAEMNINNSPLCIVPSSSGIPALLSLPWKVCDPKFWIGFQEPFNIVSIIGTPIIYKLPAASFLYPTWIAAVEFLLRCRCSGFFCARFWGCADNGGGLRLAVLSRQVSLVAMFKNKLWCRNWKIFLKAN